MKKSRLFEWIKRLFFLVIIGKGFLKKGAIRLLEGGVFF